MELLGPWLAVQGGAPWDSLRLNPGLWFQLGPPGDIFGPRGKKPFWLGEEFRGPFLLGENFGPNFWELWGPKGFETLWAGQRKSGLTLVCGNTGVWALRTG